jgi:hypothetical protein
VLGRKLAQGDLHHAAPGSAFDECLVLIGKRCGRRPHLRWRLTLGRLRAFRDCGRCSEGKRKRRNHPERLHRPTEETTTDSRRTELASHLRPRSSRRRLKKRARMSLPLHRNERRAR